MNYEHREFYNKLSKFITNKPILKIISIVKLCLLYMIYILLNNKASVYI
jgi:hypothetical protein